MSSRTKRTQWIPGEVAAKRFPGTVTVPRALLAEAYRALKSYYALPTLRAEIDRLLAQPSGPSGGVPVDGIKYEFKDVPSEGKFVPFQILGGAQGTTNVYSQPARASSEAGPDDARDAALWRDLVLLHPMDMVMLFSGSKTDKILLEKLRFFVESKRASKRSATDRSQGGGNG